jgi:hypothetical protein
MSDLRETWPNRVKAEGVRRIDCGEIVIVVVGSVGLAHPSLAWGPAVPEGDIHFSGHQISDRVSSS